MSVAFTTTLQQMARILMFMLAGFALNRLHILDCIECGSCAFTCPGKLPLVEHFRKGKQMVREANKK